MSERRLDELDKGIIRRLQRNARAPNTELARTLGVTEATIRNRVARLLDERFIEIVAVVDAKATEATISAFLMLAVQPSGVTDVAEALATCTEIRYLSLVLGPGQIMAEAFFRDHEHLLGFQNEHLARFPAITGIQTSIVVHVRKLSYEWEI
jgi:Lrp/AsnC family transcriptional regulator for asnA, asnC and gidA